MNPAVTLQSILKNHLANYRRQQALSARHAQVCWHILRCRSAAMGGWRMQCEPCQQQAIFYHACRDRHCPHCQQGASHAWAEREQQQQIPASYYHLVFTLPHELNGWVERHPEVIYRLLFHSVWQTLKRFAADPKRLGGELGALVVLHTWGQNLSRHVHLHCLIPGGVLTTTGGWKATSGNYLFPVRALSRHVRGAMVSVLRQSAERGELSGITRQGEVDETLDALMGKAWVVYAKAPVQATKNLIGYLARYSHRSAISNGRLLSDDGKTVRFAYHDYRDERNKVMALSGGEFIRRFLQHVLPKGLQRIRHYGFLANACWMKKRPLLLAAIKRSGDEVAPTCCDTPSGDNALKCSDYRCSHCHGVMRLIAVIPPQLERSG